MTISRKSLSALPEIVVGKEYFKGIENKSLKKTFYVRLKEQKIRYEDEKGEESNDSKSFRLVIKSDDKKEKSSYILKLKNDNKNITPDQRKKNINDYLSGRDLANFVIEKNKSEDENKKFLINNLLIPQYSAQDFRRLKEKYIQDQSKKTDEKNLQENERESIKAEIERLKQINKENEFSFFLGRSEFYVDEVEIEECERLNNRSWTTFVVLSAVITTIFAVVEYNYSLVRGLISRIRKSLFSS